MHKDYSKEKQSEKLGGYLMSRVAGSLDAAVGWLHFVNFLKLL